MSFRYQDKEKDWVTNMIKEDYVSFETAKLLKEKGFNSHCHFAKKTTEIKHKEEEGEWMSESEELTYIPTLQMAMKWLREVHKIHISVEMGFDVDNHQYYFFAPSVCRFSDKSGEYETPFGEKEFNTCEQACEASIRYCLENLI